MLTKTEYNAKIKMLKKVVCVLNEEGTHQKQG